MLRAAVAGALAAVMGTALYSTVASADCIHPPAWIPGESCGPAWLPPDAGIGETWRGELNDPRWAGGPITFFKVLGEDGGTPSSDQFAAQYRVVFPTTLENQTLSVSVQVLQDPNGHDSSDAVYFGTTLGTGGTNAWLVAIPPEGEPCPSPVNGRVPHDTAFPCPNTPNFITVYTTNNWTASPPVWTAMTSLPAWLKSVATWTHSPAPVLWAVTFQIDTSAAGLPITGQQQLKMFFGTRITNNGSPWVVLSTSSQATGASAIGNTPVPKVIGDWITVNPLGATCPSGITLSSADIVAASTGSPGNTINTCPGSTCTNTFLITLRNVPPSMCTSPFSIRPMIRVSDWGSTYSRPGAPWDSVGIPTGVATLDAGAFSGGPWSWDASAEAGTVSIGYTCSVAPGGSYCPFLPNAVDAGQLREIVMADVTFSTGSAFGSTTIQSGEAVREMWFTPSGAPIPVAGSPPPPPSPGWPGGTWAVCAIVVGVGLGIVGVARAIRSRGR
jgi:hypothetical protein